MLNRNEDSKFASRKFLLVSMANVAAAALLVTKHIVASDWVDVTKWSVSTYIAANVIGDKVSIDLKQ
jgi:hypothetical protein